LSGFIIFAIIVVVFVLLGRGGDASNDPGYFSGDSGDSGGGDGGGE